MRIGLNLLFMVPGEVGGSEPYLVNLLSKMADSPNEFHVFAVRGFRDAHPHIAQKCSVVQVPWSSGMQGARIAAENSWLGIEMRRRKLDLMHHGGGTATFLPGGAKVLTVHDIQYLHYPQNFVRLKRAWLRAAVPRAVRSCDQVSVPSGFVREDMVRELRAPSEKISVVPFGSEGLLGDDPASGKEVRETYRLSRPYFYFPARTYPHKNHRFIVEAFAPMAEQADLVFTGAPWFRDAEVMAAARHLGLSGKVRFLGRVSRREIAGLYRGAAATVFPSRFEGFGVPVLEAMTMDCPVISSNSASLPEIVGEAGILLEPDDLEGWTEAMDRMLTNSALRDELVERGRKRAAEFSWDRSAQLQLEVYEKALSST